MLEEKIDYSCLRLTGVKKSGGFSTSELKRLLDFMFYFSNWKWRFSSFLINILCQSTTTTRGGGLRMPPKRGHDTHRLLQTILKLKKVFIFF